MDKVKLTKTAAERIQPEAGKQLVVWDAELSGFGVRVSPGGSRTFFVQGRLNGRVKKYTVGRLGVVTADQARKEAKRIIANLELGKDPRPKINTGEADASLGDLMTAYVKGLYRQGKHSARAVEGSVKRNIQEPFPKLWKKPARSIDLDDCMDIVGRLTKDDRLREADKVRSYLKTAYSVAINARGDANAPTELRRMRITFNPARDLTKIKGSGKARDRALSVAEFRAYWQRIQKLYEPKRSLMMLHVLTGGQRQQQLARVTWADFNREEQAFVIWDTKGRREKPRRHTVPVSPQAMELIEGITGSGDYIFSCDGGLSPVGVDYFNSTAKKVCADMAEAGELEGEPFTAGAIRATIETQLMKKPYRVSSDILGQLLSHGTGGIQQRHYQHDDFSEDKMEALDKLWRLLNNIPEPGMKSAEVVELRAQA